MIPTDAVLSVSVAIQNANAAVLDSILACSLSSDKVCAAYLGLTPDVMAFLRTKRRSQFPLGNSGSMSIFNSVFGNAGHFRLMGNFDTAAIHKYLSTNLPLDVNALVGRSSFVNSTVQKANRLVIEAYRDAYKIGDPLSPFMLGIDSELLGEIANANNAKILTGFSNANAPLFRMRFLTLELWQSVFEHGFSSESVSRAILLTAKE
jgi:hypothetical protein